MLLQYLKNTQIKDIFFTFNEGYLHLAQTKSEQGKAKGVRTADFQDISVGHSKTLAQRL